MRMGGRIPGIKRVDYPEYPEVAFREAIINAIIHRDWSIDGGFIRVFMFDDRIEIISPGKLLPPITLETLQNGDAVSRLRNTAIVEVFDRLGGYIEKIGTGVRRMIDGMKEHGLNPPQFELDYDVLKVTLRGPGEHFMELAQKDIPEEQLKDLNNRQREALKYVIGEGFITNKIYRDINEVSNKTASLELKDLVKKGLLKIHDKGRATKYILLS